MYLCISEDLRRHATVKICPDIVWFQRERRLLLRLEFQLLCVTFPSPYPHTQKRMQIKSRSIANTNFFGGPGKQKKHRNVSSRFQLDIQ